MFRAGVACFPVFTRYLTKTQRLTSISRRMAHTQSQIIYAPSKDAARGLKSVFLAGTTSKVDESDWRETLSTSLLQTPITIYNPYRPDWDSSWKEDINFAPFREQVEWELEKQEEANIVVIYFHPKTQAPISLIEMGLCVRAPGKAIVVCPEGYWKKGNVEIVCRRFGVEMVSSVDELKDAIIRKMPSERPGQAL